jgi:copper resistance protein C
MFVRRISALLLLIATAVLALVTPASAHTSLKSSNPAKGASLAAAPTEIVLTFSEPVQVETGAVTVAGPGGAQWTVGPAAIAGPVVTMPVTPTGPAGQYTINYRVISADGDGVRGTVAFTLTAAIPPPTPTTTPATMASTTTTTTTTSTQAPPVTTAQPAPAAQDTSESGESGGVPVWVWIIGAVIAAAAVLFAVVRARKGGTPAE